MLCFRDKDWPDIQIFHSNAWRTTSEEMRYNERLANEDPELTYQSIRRGAEVHRLVRRHARQHIRPGMTMTEIAENIEDGTRALVEENGLESGVGFPTGLSVNNCAAHYSPNAGDTMSMLLSLLNVQVNLQSPSVLQKCDVLKVDFGVHVKGRILDSAFTLSWEHTYDNLIEAVKAATNTGIRVGIRFMGVVRSFTLGPTTGSRNRCSIGGIRRRHTRNYGVL
jgi:methionyl aminopeptidase